MSASMPARKFLSLRSTQRLLTMFSILRPAFLSSNSSWFAAVNETKLTVELERISARTRGSRLVMGVNVTQEGL